MPPVSLEKDQERIRGKRERNVARTNRFLDARLRTIGLDTEGLDRQLRERAAQRRVEKVSETSRAHVVLGVVDVK